jgi:hypothetical protein
MASQPPSLRSEPHQPAEAVVGNARREAEWMAQFVEAPQPPEDWPAIPVPHVVPDWGVGASSASGALIARSRLCSGIPAWVPPLPPGCQPPASFIPTPYGWMHDWMLAPPPPDDWELRDGTFMPPPEWSPPARLPLTDMIDHQALNPVFERAALGRPLRRSPAGDGSESGYSCPMLWCVTWQDWWFMELRLHTLEARARDNACLEPQVRAARETLRRQLDDVDGEPFQAYRLYRLMRLRAMQRLGETREETERVNRRRRAQAEELLEEIRAQDVQNFTPKY